MKKVNFNVMIEKDENDIFIATVPALKSCYTQAKTLEALIPRIKEVIELCVEEEGLPETYKTLIGIQQIEVAV